MKPIFAMLLMVVFFGCEVQVVVLNECWADVDCGNGLYCYAGSCYEDWDYCYFYDCGFYDYGYSYYQYNYGCPYGYFDGGDGWCYPEDEIYYNEPDCPYGYFLGANGWCYAQDQDDGCPAGYYDGHDGWCYPY
jgi:hypothetical protein